MLAENPAIAHVAVVGVADSRRSEVGCACIVLRADTTLTQADLKGWSLVQMANCKISRHRFVVDALPMNASKKMEKQELAAKVR